MPATAAGAVALAIDNLRNTLADSTEFRTMVGASGASAQAQARGRIHAFAIPPPASARWELAEMQAARPFALLYPPSDGGGYRAEYAAGGDGNYYSDSGRLIVELAENVPANVADDPAEVEWEWWIRIGKIIDEVLTLAGGGGYLNIASIEVTDGPDRIAEADRETRGDAVGVELTVDWR